MQCLCVFVLTVLCAYDVQFLCEISKFGARSKYKLIVDS